MKRLNREVMFDSHVNTSAPLFETFRYARLPPRSVMARPARGRPRESAWLKSCFVLLNQGSMRWVDGWTTFGAISRWDSPTRVREPLKLEILPDERTDRKITAFVMCASTGIPAFWYATINGELLPPSPPSRFGSCGETVIDIASAPRI